MGDDNSKLVEETRVLMEEFYRLAAAMARLPLEDWLAATGADKSAWSERTRHVVRIIRAANELKRCVLEAQPTVIEEFVREKSR